MQKNKKNLFWVILLSFLIIPLIVSVISSIHVINFFELSNYTGLAIALSVSFEIGALSALAGLVVMDKINKNVIYFIFILLTAYQMMGNTYYAYDMLTQKMSIDPNLIKNWTELFGFEIEDTILMKRIIAIISGAILPIVSLCFLDLSVDYIKKSSLPNENNSDKLKKKLLATNDDIIEEKSNEPIVDDVIKIEQLVVQNEPTIEEPNVQNEVISEDEKRDIREAIENKLPDNVVQTRPVGSGFHNVAYTK
jgi:hypothetical protein